MKGTLIVSMRQWKSYNIYRNQTKWTLSRAQCVPYSSRSSIWEGARNADSREAPQTYWLRIYTLLSSLGGFVPTLMFENLKQRKEKGRKKEWILTNVIRKNPIADGIRLMWSGLRWKNSGKTFQWLDHKRGTVFMPMSKGTRKQFVEVRWPSRMIRWAWEGRALQETNPQHCCNWREGGVKVEFVISQVEW